MDWNFWRPNKILETRTSKFNGKITVRKSWGLGTYLEVGGLTQSGWILEKIWSQTLRHLHNSKFSARGGSALGGIIHNSLILGLGGGSVIKPLKKYWPKAKITGVDIDPVMVKLGQKYLNLDKSVQIVISDAFSYMRHATGYDLVIVDLYHGKDFPQKFESDKFLKKLSKNKLVIINRAWNKRDNGLLIVDFREKLQKYFRDVDLFYPVANVMFVCSN